MVPIVASVVSYLLNVALSRLANRVLDATASVVCRTRRPVAVVVTHLKYAGQGMLCESPESCFSKRPGSWFTIC